jgi:hypothetical protein
MSSVINEGSVSRGAAGRQTADFTLDIDDQRASELYDSLDAASPLERSQYKKALRNWAETKLAEEQSRNYDELTGIYADVNRWWEGSGGGQADDEVKFGAANRKFIAAQTGQSAREMGDLYPSERDRWFLQNMGKAPKTESEAFELVRKSFETKKQTDEAYDLIAGDVALSLFDQVNKGTPVDIPTLMTKWKEENAEILDALPDNWEANTLKAAEQYYVENEQMLRDHGDVLQRLYANIINVTGRKVEGAPEDDVKTVEDLNAIIDGLGELPKEVRDRGYAAIFMAAKRQGMDDKGFWEMAAEAWPRSLNMVRTTALVAQETDAEAKVALLQGEGPLFRNKNTGQLTRATGTAFSPQDFEEVSTDDRATLLQQAERELQRFNVVRELRDLADNRFDPIKSNATGPLKFAQDIALLGPQSLAFTGVAAIPVVGPVLTGAAIYADEYNQLRLEGFTPSQSRTLAAVSAPLQTAAEVFGAKLVFGRYKWYRETIQKLVNPARFARTTQGAVSFFGKVVGENITEGTQDLTTPLVQDVAAALSDEFPDVNWEETLTQWKDSRLEVLAATLMPVIGGHMVETFADGERFASAERRQKMMYDPTGINEQERRYIEDGTTPQERRNRYVETLKNMPPERVQAAKDRIAEQSRAAATNQEDAAMPTMETQKDTAGRMTYIVRDEKGVERYRTTSQEAAEDAYRMAVMKSTAAQFSADRIATKELIDWWTQQDPNNVVRLEGSRTAQQELERLQGLGDTAGIETLHRRIAQDPRTAGQDYSTLTILGTASIETVAEGVFRGVIALNESSRPKDALEEINHVFVRRAVAQGSVNEQQLRDWLTATEAITGETYAKDNFDDIIESLAIVAEAYVSQRIDQNAESQLPASFVDYLKRLVQVLKEVMARGLALRRGFADGTLGQDYEQFLAESVGLADQTVVDRSREKTAQEVAPEVANYSIGVTSQQDADYLAAVERGDMETAQRMVDEAARRAGFDIGPVWHGGADGFDVFDWRFIGAQGNTEGKGFYFSNDRDLAAGYAERHGGRLLRVYLRSGKPIDGKKQTISEATWRRILRIVHQRSEQSDDYNSPLWNYADISVDGLTSAIEETARILTESSESDVDTIAGFVNGGADPEITYDAIYEITGKTGIVESEAWGRAGHEVYVATSANHVKLADPVTYDSQGNVIPLSQRFDATTGDINYSIGSAAQLAAQNAEMAKEIQRKADAVVAADQEAEDVFFTQFWPKMLKKAGLNLKPTKANLTKAAEYTMPELLEWLKDNPQYLDYYHKDWDLTKTLLQAVYPNMTDDQFIAFRLFTGITSPNTKLRSNMADAVQLFDLWMREGSIKSMEWEWSAKGNRKVKTGPFMFSGTTGAGKTYAAHVLEDIFQELGSWQAVLDHLYEAVTVKEINAYRNQRGWATGIEVGKVKEVVKAATGQSDLIPRMFIFGPKVGAYTLNTSGDDRFTTTDIWEGRFIRSHFPSMFETADGLPVSVEENRIFQEFSQAFNEVFQNMTGLNLPPSALQAVRWFFMLNHAKKAGYRYASTDDTISGYAAQAIRGKLGFDLGVAGQGGRGSGQAGDGAGSQVGAVSNYSISTQSEIDRVGAALNRLDRDPLDSLGYTEKIRERFAQIMAENMAELQAMQQGGVAERTVLDEEGNPIGPQPDAAKTKATGAEMRRTKFLQALGELDGLLSVLPPQVAAKVGGYTVLTNIGTGDRALSNFFIKRLEMIDKELERYLKDRYTTALKELFKRAKPKRDDAGKVPKGKLGAGVHTLFERLEMAVEMSSVEIDGEIASLEQQIASGELEPEQEAASILLSDSLPLFGEWKTADASRMAQAVQMGYDIYRIAYKKQQAKALLRKNLRDQERIDAKDASGAPDDTAPVRQQNKNEAEQLKSKTKGIVTNLLGFDQLMSLVFGRDSAFTKKWVNWQRKSDNAKDDEFNAVYDQWSRFLATLTKHKKPYSMKATYAGQDLAFAMSEPKHKIKHTNPFGKEVEFEFSQADLLDITMMWMQPKGRAHMIGKLNDYGDPIDDWSYDQTFVSKAEALLTNEAKAVRTFLLNDYAQEWGSLNEVFVRLNDINLPQEQFYSPLSVNPVQTTQNQTVDALTGFTIAVPNRTPPSLRSRGAAVAEPVFRNAIDKWFAHRLQMAHWKAYAEFNNEALSVLGHRNVRNAIEAKVGQAGLTSLQHYLTYFQQGGNRAADANLELTKALRGILGRAITMSLFGRIGTVLIQFTQLGAAAAKMPLHAYLRRFSKLMTGQMGWGEALNSPYIQRRIAQMPPQVQVAMAGLRANKPSQIREAARRVGWLLSGNDGLSTAGTYAMVYDYQLEQMKKAGMTGAQAEAAAREEAERTTDEIAQPTRAGARSSFELSQTSPLQTVAWAFASEPRKNVALLAYLQRAKRPLTEKGRATLYVFIINGLFAAIVRTMLRDLRDDEDDEIFDWDDTWSPKRLAMMVMTEPLYGVPVLGEMAEEAIFRAFREYRPEGSLYSVADPAFSLSRVPEHFSNLLEGEVDGRRLVKDINNILRGFGYAYPTAAGAAALSNLGKEVYEMADNIFGEDE